MTEELISDERYRKAHHYYVNGVVALSQVRDEAQRRKTDKRSPEDSVLHFHEYDEKEELRCPPNVQHEYYVVGG